MDCIVYMLVPKDEFEEIIHTGKKNKSAYKYAFIEPEEDKYLTKEIYKYLNNKDYYLYELNYELEYAHTASERFLCISELFEQLPEYQILIIKEDGSKFIGEIGFPYSKGFEYPPLKCPIEKSFKYLEKQN